MRMTASLVAAAYTMLRLTPPFLRWRLPRADELEFRVSEDDHYGEFQPGEKPAIVVSNKMNGRLSTLLETVAHEMAHLKMDRGGAPGGYNHANPEFRRLIADICNHQGFDPKCL